MMSKVQTGERLINEVRTSQKNMRREIRHLQALGFLAHEDKASELFYQFDYELVKLVDLLLDTYFRTDEKTIEGKDEPTSTDVGS